MVESKSAEVQEASWEGGMSVLFQPLASMASLFLQLLAIDASFTRATSPFSQQSYEVETIPAPFSLKTTKTQKARELAEWT